MNSSFYLYIRCWVFEWVTVQNPPARYSQYILECPLLELLYKIDNLTTRSYSFRAGDRCSLYWSAISHGMALWVCSLDKASEQWTSFIIRTCGVLIKNSLAITLFLSDSVTGKPRQQIRTARLTSTTNFMIRIEEKSIDEWRKDAETDSCLPVSLSPCLGIVPTTGGRRLEMSGGQDRPWTRPGQGQK